MVESAPLLREWTVLSRPEGSNPSHSAISSIKTYSYNDHTTIRTIKREKLE